MSLLSVPLRQALASGGVSSFELPLDQYIPIENLVGELSRLFEGDMTPLVRDGAAVRAHAERVDVGLRDDQIVFHLEDGAVITIAPFFLQQGRAGHLACGRCRGPACPHALGVALALAWLDPERRAQLRRAPWRTLLGPLAAPPPTPPPDDRPDGWLEVLLHRWPQGSDREQAQAPAGGRATILLVPTARSNGRPLPPREAPRSLSALEGKVRLSASDRALARVVEQRRLLGHIARHKYQGSAQVDEEIARLDEAFFAGLAEVRAVTFGDPPAEVRVQRDPLKPSLTVDDAAGGGLSLRFSPGVSTVFPVGHGWILTTENVLAPVAPDFPPALVPALHRIGLPPVHASDVADFVSDFLPTLRLPFNLNAHHPAIRRPRPVPVLLLTIEGQDLGVAVAFDYAGSRVSVDDRAGVLTGDTDGVAWARDTEAEHAALAAVRHRLPRVLPTRLADDDALAFLLEVPPALNGWRVEADPRLAARRPVGRLTASMRLTEGEDWFDLSARFQVADWKAEAKPQAVIAAWRAGQRFVALTDGRLAALPETWLARHGSALAELEDVRRAAGNHLGGFATGLARELLAEADDVEAKALWTKLSRRAVHFGGVPDLPAPTGLTVTLRDYQLRGFAWLRTLYHLNLGAVLADDMGLGKTIQTLALLLAVHRPGDAPPPRAEVARRPSLVVAPTSVLHEWVQQAARFAPSLRVALHHGPNRPPVPPDDVDLVVTSHALLRREPEVFGAGWQVLVLDEAQAIKNPEAELGRALRALPTAGRVALTGTPLENHPGELWSLFQFLMPGFFGPLSAFVERYARPIVERGSVDALQTLKRRIRPFVLRRLKAEVATELPPRQVQILRCTLSTQERRLYDRVRETYRDVVLTRLRPVNPGAPPAARRAKGRHPAVPGVDLRVLEALTRLRQACCDAALLPFGEAAALTMSSKRQLLAELLAERIDEGHRTLVFSQWTGLLDRVQGDLEAAGHAFCRLDGTTRDREAQVRRFQADDGPPVFLLSLKAGGTGLNLTAADCVVHLDPWFNPATEAQASDRAHRIGQRRPVVIYKLVAEDTVEEKILVMQARKAELAAAMLDDDRISVDRLSVDDLAAIFDHEAEVFSAAPGLPAVAPGGLPAAVAALAAGGARLTRSAVRDALNREDREVGALIDEWALRGLLVPERRGEHTVFRVVPPDEVVAPQAEPEERFDAWEGGLKIDWGLETDADWVTAESEPASDPAQDPAEAATKPASEGS